jgi:flagellar basal-body rod protein FlgG
MLRGIYTATSGMLTAQRDINVRGNNLANLSTPGFKSDRLVTTTFAESLAIRQQMRTTGRKVDIVGMEQPHQPRNARNEYDAFGDEIEAALQRLTLSRGKTALEIMTDFSQGAFQATERRLDFAIGGEGFFVIQSHMGEFDEIDNVRGTYGGMYYTRNGQFQIDEEGYLINGLGDYVLDDTEQTIWVGTDNFLVNEFGDIFLDGEDTGIKLGIYNPDNPYLLIKQGEDIFTILNEDFEPEPLEFTGVIRQNYIERPNTDVAAEMAGMMTASRSFQSMSQILKAIDATLGKSISEVGRV